MIHYLNQNTGAVTALATLALLLVTGWYAWTTRALLAEARRTRFMASEPRVVAYIRVHEVHSSIVQLCIANLSGAAAVSVSAEIQRKTEWPATFDFGDSKILRDLRFLRPHEVLKFDLSHGPALFHDGMPAVFHASVMFESIDGRKFINEAILNAESVSGFASWQVRGIDDVARNLDKIAAVLEGYSGSRRIQVNSYNATDRENEHLARKEEASRRQ